MGDSRRNEIFANFIVRNFPKAKRILVVADGKGELAALLTKKYIVKVIEARPRQTIKRKRLTYKKGWFDTSYEVTEDLIVGMHPDEATAEIVKSARKYKKKFAIVPCCIKGIEAHGVRGFTEWVKKLMKLGKPCRHSILKFSGKNIVIWG